ncbi:tetratricopeptide repeat protein [Terasakiella sp. A23]|uniref:tetratricopeptide repeat protein n=1 Tax=Terasakiella sp. FCG-A23 TaxID=3080561 RepID=UPI0029548195|nr:tetratricopeptide repeat protein [Terasakiella sp. A23]MDV7340666.1 tetratricopeptide repeat protein [Terasakiella sp. A23]
MNIVRSHQMLRILSIMCLLSMASACALPSPANLPAVVSEKHVRPDHRERISHRLLWLAPEQQWHYNCLFLKPLAALTFDEQKLALPSADILFRAHFEEKRLAYRSAGFLYRQAADQGIAMAYVKLGNLLIDGKGTQANPKGGAKLVYQSGLLDCAEGQHRYAELLTEGKGVRGDLVQAWGWAEMAKKQGYPGSGALQKKMESVMAPAQMALAREQARTLRSQLDLFNHGPNANKLVQCTTDRNRTPFYTRMRACHAMGGTHQGEVIDFRSKQ